MGFKKPFKTFKKDDRPGRPVGRNSRPPRRDSNEYARDSGFVRNERPRYGAEKRDGARSLELFDVTCESCGKETQVPFKPTGDRPVYCRDCFNKQDERPTRKGNERTPRAAQSDDLAEIHRKLDKIMAALKIR